MRKFFIENVTWLRTYFEKTKWMFEIIVFFFALQTFLYSINPQSVGDITPEEIGALKIVFWILIFIITLLLYIQTDSEYKPEEDKFDASLFTGAIFSKYFVRLLIYTLLLISASIFGKQLTLSFHNRDFEFFWIAAGMGIFFEIIRFFNFLFRKIQRRFKPK
jgi:hypothetical protein